MPIGLLLFHMFRGNNFAFPKWATTLAIIFMVVTCINRLNTIASYRYPAFRFYVLCEALGGFIALIVGFSLPYLMKLAVDAPTRHRMNGLQNEVKLYQQLDAIITQQSGVIRDQVLKELQSQKVNKDTLQRVEALLNTLA
jgi:maltodextrin utilization protein YvdJ